MKRKPVKKDGKEEGRLMEEWLCLGPCLLTEGGVGVSFRRPDGDEIAYSRSKSLRRCVAGGIYTANFDPESGSVRDVHFVRRHDDRDLVLLLQADERTFEDQRKAEKTEAAAKYDEYFERLEPLRIAYARTNARGKQLLLANLIEYITRR